MQTTLVFKTQPLSNTIGTAYTVNLHWIRSVGRVPVDSDMLRLPRLGFEPIQKGALLPSRPAGIIAMAGVEVVVRCASDGRKRKDHSGRPGVGAVAI